MLVHARHNMHSEKIKWVTDQPVVLEKGRPCQNHHKPQETKRKGGSKWKNE